ncbi:hypothetical protein [Streptomyces pacificus]|uniref:Uncharacterized protein n=1 Tax=Streptomyces pacificus TaxID=2705029 RepID=A0A6A0AQ18_9ACTN|nr:hypothetical protein [Streptomyces pacificus]GFH35036.1 hypothetical protein SCWH03_12500 [Streptomyces pacificus]
MPNPTSSVTRRHRRPAGLGQVDAGLAELRGDGARMAPHWVVPPMAAAAPVPPALIRGIAVSAASARLVGSMPGYGD